MWKDLYRSDKECHTNKVSSIRTIEKDNPNFYKYFKFFVIKTVLTMILVNKIFTLFFYGLNN